MTTTPRPHIPSHWTRLSSHNFFPSSWHWEPLRESYSDSSKGIRWNWNSRAGRKGIPPLPASTHSLEEEKAAGDRPESWTIKRQRIRWIGFDYFDISWWVAIIFTVGSIFWCVNAILFFCYFTNVSPAFTNTESATAFLGGLTFLVGGYLGWVESLNPTREVEFGWEIDELTHTLREPSHHHNKLHSLGRNRHHFGFQNFTPTKTIPEHSSLDLPPAPTTLPKPPSSLSPSLAPNTLSPPPNNPSASASSSSDTLSQPPSPPSPNSNPPQKWRWYGVQPSLAYIANTIQLFGASIFFLSVLCGLPGVLPVAGSSGGPEQGGRTEGLWIGLYWATQVAGAPCFVIAGALFSIEVQKNWWKPEPKSLGWWIGAWNVVGGFGFWFCGIFGIWRQTSLSDPTLYQKWGTAFSTFWGSWAFLIGSYLQLWEGINKRS